MLKGREIYAHTHKKKKEGERVYCVKKKKFFLKKYCKEKKKRKWTRICKVADVYACSEHTNIYTIPSRTIPPCRGTQTLQAEQRREYLLSNAALESCVYDYKRKKNTKTSSSFCFCSETAPLLSKDICRTAALKPFSLTISNLGKPYLSYNI